MDKLTETITNDFLNSIGIYLENSRHDICYEGYIGKTMSCYERIIEYYKLQRNIDELPTILTLSTPSIFRIYSDNNITYTLMLNGMRVGVMGSEDVEYVFKKELRTFKVDSILQ